MNPLAELTALGQSVWYDNIERRLLKDGTLAGMIARGEIRGITSNPSIFQKAIASGHDYDAALVPLAWAGWTPEPIFWQLAVEDIQAACDLFLPLYEETKGDDGYVSLEVSPYLADNTQATLEQAKELWQRVARPNLMIKIPATPAGLPAIRQALAQGINVNVTLIFSIQRYRQVMDAYLAGLEDRLQAGGDVRQLASVASFFVSRMDVKVDALLPENSPLRGRAAIANAKLAYQAFQEVFSGERFARLQAQGARVQRPLWASTSTKDPAYPDTLYVAALIGPQTVNTVPPQTLAAFKDHGLAQPTLTEGVEEARAVLAELAAAGIDLDQVTQTLEDEGVQKFATAFTDLLETIDRRRREAVAALGPLWTPTVGQVAAWAQESAPQRIWQPDPAFWTADAAGQEEVRRRMGWLDLPHTSRPLLTEIAAFREEIRAAGLRKVLWIGMGGSSLAAEVFARVFTGDSELSFAVLDSTHPEQVAAAAEAFSPEETLYVAASKSGTTAEVLANLAFFWERSGEDGTRFAVVTDPGSPLAALAQERSFRRIFLADPQVGGRYSVLTAFGLLAAGLQRVDLDALLQRAAWMREQTLPDVLPARNPGLVLGAVLAAAAQAGRDKITFLADPPLTALSDWLEQLLAESSGKQGRGLVPVVGEPVLAAKAYAADRLFVYFRHNGALDAHIQALHAAGHPLVVCEVPTLADLGAVFYRWEFAVAAACAALGVNAFDQPDVQEAKARARTQIAAFRSAGRLDVPPPDQAGDGWQLWASVPLPAQDALAAFLAMAQPGRDYVALNAFAPRTAAVQAVLQQLRGRLQAATACPVTLGYGPRYLHSTGQLHKGGPNEGVFIVLTADPKTDMPIPGQDGLTFGALLLGQAVGDYEALLASGRRVVRLHLADWAQALALFPES